MLFNGAPTFAASLFKDSDFTQHIQTHGEKTENHVAIVATGVPAASSPYFMVASCEEDAFEYDALDPKGRKIKSKAWWNDEEQLFLCKLHTDKGFILQTRKLIEEDILLVRMECFKSDGSCKGVDCTLRRTSSTT